MPYSNIDKPNKYFNTVLYTGNGSTQSITGVGFQPDWVWTKSRSNAVGNLVYDVLRGTNKSLSTRETRAEETDSPTSLTSFNSDGFSLGSNTGINGSGYTFVSWNWLANGAGVSNTAGTITSTVSANTTSGFSIVSYTGTGANATVGHGLGVTPKMVIVKNRNTTNGWEVYHASLGATKVILLNSTEAQQTSASSWNNTAPTSTLFSIGTATGVNGNTNPIIAYCFADVKGYSKFGSFVGNGSTDGTYVHLGFRPAFVMIKGTQNLASATPDWRIRNNKTNTYNPITTTLYANSSGAEVTEDNHDFLSNGFKVRTSGAENNYSGETYIYMAFAENPFVSSKGIPTTAR
jgi:hypothetical protein